MRLMPDSHDRSSGSTGPPGSAHPGMQGPVMLIGGAEDKRRERSILSRFVQLAGEADAHISVIGTASSLGDRATAGYGELFTALGAGRVTGLRPLTREDSADPQALGVLGESTGVFLTGGNQIRLTTVLAGTRLGDALARAHDRGAVIAGTSAGASALSSHMVAFGRSGELPKHRMVHIASGLGLVSGVVVDQHFQERLRLGRLLAAVALSPSLVGVGLDEDTAAIVHADRKLEVIGRGAVLLVDGSGVVTDAFEAKGHRPMLVSGAIVHSLPAGSWFDLRSRTLIAGPEGRAQPPQEALPTERKASE
jgi:cyanophycinase